MQAEVKQPPSMLKRYQNYIEPKPFLGWSISVALGLLYYLIVYGLVVGTKFNFMLIMFACFGVSLPTRALISRFENPETRPFEASQETAAGILAFLVSLSSIGTYALAFFGGRANWPMNTVGPLLFVFGFFAALSAALGYAARRSRPGIWAMRTTAALLTTMIMIVLLTSLRQLLVHP